LTALVVGLLAEGGGTSMAPTLGLAELAGWSPIAAAQAGFNTRERRRPHRLTADELEVYFDNHIGTAYTDIYAAQRGTTGQPSERNPSVSSDGLMLLFESLHRGCKRESGPRIYERQPRMA